MKIPVIFILAVAAAGAARPPRAYETVYREPSSFFDSPPPPPPRSSFRNSYGRHESSYLRHPQSFSDELAYFGDGPPSNYREERLYFDSPPPSSYFPPRRPHFYQHAPSNFREGHVFTEEYKGPPPPARTENPLLQSTAALDERPNDSPELESSKAYEEHLKGQQPTITTSLPRKPLSFGGHSNHLSFGNYALGFASVAGATAADINPLAEITSTTRAMHSTSGGVQVSQQQAATEQTPQSSTEQPATSAASSATTKIAAASQANTASTASGTESTTPSTTAKTTLVTPKANINLDPVQQEQSGQQAPPGQQIMLHELPRTSYDFRTITQEYPPIAHGQLPIEPARPAQYQLPDVKQNFLFYETKNSFPLQQSDYRIQQQPQQQQSSFAATPVRFSIPTAPINVAGVAPASAAAPDPVTMKLAFQGAAPIAFATVPNTNAYAPGQNQIDLSQLAKLTSAINSAPSSPSYYIVQNPNYEQTKPAAQISSGTPLGSFYLLPSTEQNKQPVVQMNQMTPTGLQLQLSGFGGVEFLTSSSNSEPMRMADMGIGKASPSFMEQFRSPEPTYTKIGFGQSPW